MATPMLYNVKTPNIQVTHKIIDAASEAASCCNITKDLKCFCLELFECDMGNTVISTKRLREIYDTLRSAGIGHKVFLHEIVEDAAFIPPARELPPRNPELEKRVQRLKIEQENLEYKRMTKNVDPMVRGKANLSFNEEVKIVNRQIIAVANFLITVVAAFAFGYKGVELAFGKIFPMQMMSGLLLGMVVFFVDLYFMLKYDPL